MSIDRRKGTNKRPVPTGETMFPQSKPERPGGGKGSSGRPDSQRPAPKPKVTN